jgi:16S rRNA (guanine527-N7)-methyltransferase
LRALQPEKIKNMVDIGTGAGFPGIPLKIAYPHINTLLVDSVGKRVNFLLEVIETLDLQGITAIHSRAEDLGRDAKYREKYDLCTSRAVARLASLSEYCLPFVEKGGYFVSYKAGDCDIEVEESKKALRLLGGRLKSVEKFQLGDMQRALVVIEKTAITSRLYPRKAGTPTKSPLV